MPSNKRTSRRVSRGLPKAVTAALAKPAAADSSTLLSDPSAAEKDKAEETKK